MPQTPTSDQSILHRIRETHGNLKRWWLKLWGSGLLIVVAGFTIAWWFVEPAPPRELVIAAGPRDGAYYHFARRYAELFERHGIELKVRETSGSIENYRLLATSDDINVAIVQGGTASDQQLNADDLQAIASLYLEPVWVFYRADQPLNDLRELRGKSIAIGLNESGTQSIARLLLRENGVTEPDAARYVAAGGQQAANQLIEGELDAAIFVTSPEAEVIRRLMRSDDVRLMNFMRYEAYAQRYPFLSNVVLRRGVIDLEHDLPPQDVHLIAPAANLVATMNLHDSLTPLFAMAAKRTHERGGRLVEAGRFPSLDFVEFPVNDSARRYFESGPPFLQKYLTFWVASAIDRGMILLLPALTLMFPLFKIAPPLYRWRIRSRIYRWYEVLRQIERDLQQHEVREILHRHTLSLADVHRELDDLDNVPLAYMEEFYNLRLHVELVERRLRKAVEELPEETPAAG